MPAGDKGGAIQLKPPTTRAIKAFDQLFHTLIKINPKLTKDARRLSAATRIRRGR